MQLKTIKEFINESKSIYYFAYGSNMNIARMIDREVIHEFIGVGILKNYRFVINKISKKNPEIGFANVVEDNKKDVEGYVYQVNNIEQLDKFEGYPTQYNRVIKKIKLNGKYIDCHVYIANKNVTSDDVLPTKEYMNHILQGKKLSNNYYNALKQIKTID